MRTLTSFAALLILLSHQITTAQTWTGKSPVSQPLEEVRAIGAGDHVYLIGGSDTLGNAQSRVEQYDPATDSWTIVDSMPTPREELNLALVDSVIYAIGGGFDSVPMVAVEAYDLANASWSSKSPLPTGRREHGCASFGSDIYVFGGTGTPGAKKSVEKFNTSSGNWTAMDTLNTEWKYMATEEVGGRIYLIGGDSGSVVTGRIMEFDPGSGNYNSKSPMPTPRSRAASAVVDGKIYVFGGVDTNKIATNICEVYDPATDSWSSTSPMIETRETHAGASLKGIIYAIGGLDSAGNILSSVEILPVNPLVSREESMAEQGIFIPHLDHDYLRLFWENVQPPNPNARIRISTTDGKLIHEKNIELNSIRGETRIIDKTGLPKGIILISIDNGDRRISKRIINL